MEKINDRVSIEYRDHVAIVSLNRPEKFNGMDLEMMQALLVAARRIRKARNVRAVVLRGEGKAFCSGLDFARVMRRPARVLTRFITLWRKDNFFQRVCLAWRELPVPVIAVTHGYCFGAGMQLALACDFRFSAAVCEYSFMEVEWGIIPDMSGSVTLRELVPVDVAMELAMTGRRFDADEALGLNLVSRIDEQSLDVALRFAEELARRSPDAISGIKKLFRSTRACSERSALRRERWLQLKVLAGANQREAMRAKREKREPVFRSR